jgi:DNA-binding CsgD family transcriptional regulator
MTDSRRSSSVVYAANAPGELARGRACCRTRAWADAYEALSSADRGEPLGAADLELLATSAYLVGRDGDYLKALERAHALYLDSGDLLRSTRCLFWLGMRLALRGDVGQASGWFGRAERILERWGDSCVEQGYLLLPIVEEHLAEGELDAAYAAAGRAAAIGERFEDVDLMNMARHQQGRARLRQWQLGEGLALLDEVMIAALAGQLSPIVTGLMYCSVIGSYLTVYAFGRANEWNSALARFCADQPEMVAFTGPCLVHRAELLELSGAWPQAIEEAQRACEHPASKPLTVMAALCRLGEIYRLQGDLAAAEAAYRKASELGSLADPGLARLRLTQGRPDAARVAICRALAATSDEWQRATLLPVYVEILLANGDVEEAQNVCRELDGIAKTKECGPIRAMAAQACGALELARGNAEAALPSLRNALHAWQELDAPYPAAKTRVLTALAYRSLDDDEGCSLELEAARVAFDRLGAIPDVERIDALVRPRDAVRSHGLTARELEVLRLVADGNTNKAMAAQLFVSERTIDRHVSNIFVKLGVSSRAAATACAYKLKLF